MSRVTWLARSRPWEGTWTTRRALASLSVGTSKGFPASGSKCPGDRGTAWDKSQGPESGLQPLGAQSPLLPGRRFLHHRPSPGQPMSSLPTTPSGHRQRRSRASVEASLVGTWARLVGSSPPDQHPLRPELLALHRAVLTLSFLIKPQREICSNTLEPSLFHPKAFLTPALKTKMRPETIAGDARCCAFVETHRMCSAGALTPTSVWNNESMLAHQL